MPPGGRMGGPFQRGFMTEEEKANQPKITKELLKRVFSYLKPYWKQLTLVLVCIAVSSTLSLYPSVLTGSVSARNLPRLVTPDDGWILKSR